VKPPFRESGLDVFCGPPSFVSARRQGEWEGKRATISVLHLTGHASLVANEERFGVGRTRRGQRRYVLFEHEDGAEHRVYGVVSMDSAVNRAKGPLVVLKRCRFRHGGNAAAEAAVEDATLWKVGLLQCGNGVTRYTRSPRPSFMRLFYELSSQGNSV